MVVALFIFPRTTPLLAVIIHLVSAVCSAYKYIVYVTLSWKALCACTSSVAVLMSVVICTGIAVVPGMRFTCRENCRPLPELPSMLREGISEADWKSYADHAKPHVDKAIGA